MNPTQHPQSIGENQIDQSTMQHVAPDVASPQGQQQLFGKAVQAHVAKKQLDAIMGAVSSHLGATTNSRVKNIETAGKKIAQKRLQGREYNITDMNDMLGSRLVVNTEKDIPKAKKVIEKLAEAGVFAINKQQQVKQGTYEAYHYDVTLTNGTDAEIQVHTPQSEAEASVNHTLRAVHGEKPLDPAVTMLKNKQADMARKLPVDKAKAVTGAIQQLAQGQGGNVSPLQSAQILAQSQQ